MIIINSQENVVFDYPEYVHTLILKISGGLDSAITAYMLAKYIVEERTDIKVVPITVISPVKAYQAIFAKQVLNFVSYEVGNVFLEHQVLMANSNSDYTTAQERLLNVTREKFEIHGHLNGITRNPPPEIMLEFQESGIPPDRNIPKSQFVDWGARIRHQPLININKQGVAELYDTMGIRESLFPLTRSCSARSTDFTHPCGNCWFCAERDWGFS